ncbi:hypothetical protein Tco_0410249 [Tanacetum coccineum]
MMKFSEISGLIPNMEKSTVFFRNVKDEVKDRILDVLPFAVGKLLMKYVETRKGKEEESLALDREERRDEKEEVGLLETRSNNVSGQEI